MESNIKLKTECLHHPWIQLKVEGALMERIALMTTYEYGNGSLYGIKNNTSRYLWAGGLLLILLSSLIGDTTILIASIKYKSIKLHRVIIVVIHHIAVCDLLVAFTDILPKIISVLAGEWVLGNTLCKLTPYARYYFDLSSLLLISCLTTNKMLLLKYPLRFGATTQKGAHVFCAACWTAALTFPVVFLILDLNDIYFSFRGYQCNYGYSSPVYQWLKPLLAAILIFIPNCAVIANTITILVIAKKSARRCRGSLKWQGIMATALTAVIYCLSVLPLVVYRIGESFYKVQDKSKSFFYTHFYRIAISFIFVNTISNFFIYNLTVTSFRDFVLLRLQQSYKLIMNIESSSSPGDSRRTKITSNGDEGTKQTSV